MDNIEFFQNKILEYLHIIIFTRVIINIVDKHIIDYIRLLIIYYDKYLMIIFKISIFPNIFEIISNFVIL